MSRFWVVEMKPLKGGEWSPVDGVTTKAAARELAKDFASDEERSRVREYIRKEVSAHLKTK